MSLSKDNKARDINLLLSENNISRNQAAKLLEVNSSTVSNYLNHSFKAPSHVLSNWYEELTGIVNEMKRTANEPIIRSNMFMEDSE